jgi:ATP-binding cassette subfamily F protein 3
VEEGRLVHDVGSYEEAREKRKLRQTVTDQQARVEDKAAAAAALPLSPSAKQAKKRNTFKLAQLEQEIGRLEARQNELRALLSGPQTDYAVLLGWQQELEQNERKREELYHQWGELQEL